MTRVAVHREWSTKTEANGKSMLVEHACVFGWRVRRHLMEPGSMLVTHAAQEIPRSRVPNRAMYVKGTATVLVNGSPGEDRVPGLYTQERPPYPAGEVKVTAVEEVEFWCFNFFENGRRLPALTPVRLPLGGVLALSAGQLLFVMRGAAGALAGPCTYIPPADETLPVGEDLYGFLIGEARS